MRTLPALLLAVSAFAVGWAGGWTEVQAKGHEEILSFKSRIHVNENSSVTVAESITVRAAGKQIKRGIYRDFPTTYKDRYGNILRVLFAVESATRNGAKVPFWVENRSNGKRVYMGDKNVRIKPGVYTFVLTYTTDRQIGFLDDFDELYWNVTGNDWAFPIAKAEAIVMIPPKAHVVQKTAYTGPRGAEGKDFISSIDANGFARFKTTRTLNPGEGLTIAVAWPKGFLSEPTKSEKAARLVHDNRPVLVGLIGFLLLLGYYLFAWDRVGRDPKAGTIVPLFEPPEGFSPAAVNYLSNMGFQDKAFAAAIVNMAVKGVLKIEDVDGEFSLFRLSDDYSVLAPGERVLARKLFRYHSSIELKQKNHKSIKKALDAFKEKLSDEMENIYFQTNKRWLIPGAVMTFLTVLVVAVSMENDEGGFIILFMSVWLSVWTVAVYAMIAAIVVKWKVALSGGKLGNMGSAIFASLFAVPFVIGEVFGIFMLIEGTSLLTTVILLAIIGLLILFHLLLKAPTLKGRRVMDKIEGFKLFLSVAEHHRLEAMHPPEVTPELFEEYLPYAMALGVDTQWSENFAGILDAAGQTPSTGYRPSWYYGSSWNDHGISGLGEGLGGGLTSAMASSSTAPGSGGGGSSGGGGGGGGGGGF
jgi:uncharacterized membrane protein